MDHIFSNTSSDKQKHCHGLSTRKISRFSIEELFSASCYVLLFTAHMLLLVHINITLSAFAF